MNFPTLGQKLKYFRKRADLSQFDLENITNLSTGTISRIESGAINPTKETISKIIDKLKLNDLEFSYIIGNLAKPATTDEINSAIKEIQDHFNKKSVLAYLLDDRSRMLSISKGFQLLLTLNSNDLQKIIGKTMPQIIIDPSLGLRQYIETDNFHKSTYYAFKRTWDEMNFMLEDPYYKEIIKWINKEKIIKEFWDSFYDSNNPSIRTEESRTVYFKYKGRDIKMTYTNEVVPRYPRFRVVEYKPSNFLLQLLSKFL